MTTIVSYSEIFKYQTCQRQYYYRFILNRRPVEESNAIDTGVKGHKLLQSFYELLAEGKTKEEALEVITQLAKKIVNSQHVTDFSLLTAWTLVSNYITETDFTSEAVLVENRFLIPAEAVAPASMVDAYGLRDVQIGFTPDLVVKRKGNWLDVEDYKFVQRAWSQKKINRYQQSKLYQIFLERMGYNISRSLIRFFNVQTSRISEKTYTLNTEQEKILIHDFMKGVAEVVKFKTQPAEFLSLAPRTMNYSACQFCHFEFPCSLEADGKDATKTLETQYVESTYDYSR